MLYQFIKALLFLIGITMFSCYVLLQSTVTANSISTTMMPVSYAWMHSFEHPLENEIRDNESGVIKHLTRFS